MKYIIAVTALILSTGIAHARCETNSNFGIGFNVEKDYNDKLEIVPNIGFNLNIPIGKDRANEECDAEIKEAKAKAREAKAEAIEQEIDNLKERIEICKEYTFETSPRSILMFCGDLIERPKKGNQNEKTTFSNYSDYVTNWGS